MSFSNIQTVYLSESDGRVAIGARVLAEGTVGTVEVSFANDTNSLQIRMDRAQAVRLLGSLNWLNMPASENAGMTGIDSQSGQQ